MAGWEGLPVVRMVRPRVWVTANPPQPATCEKFHKLPGNTTTTESDHTLMTPLVVAALAAVQMRTARAAYDARLAWERAREAWLRGALYDTDAARVHRDAQRAVIAADRAYQAACDDLLAETLERSAPGPVEQLGLF